MIWEIYQKLFLPRWLTMHLIDFRVGGQDFVSQFLGCWEHFSVVGCNQILNKLLELVPVHLKKSLWYGKTEFDLIRLANPVEGECHNVSAIENVLVPTITCHGCYLAPVKADGHFVGHFWFSCSCCFCHSATQVESWKEKNRLLGKGSLL